MSNGKQSTSLPAAFDLRQPNFGLPPLCSPEIVLDQQGTDTCLSFVPANTYRIQLRRQYGVNPDGSWKFDFQPSVMFIGFMTKYKGLDVSFRSLKSDGVCPEADYPWDPLYLQHPSQPSDQALADAALHKVITFQKTGRSIEDVKQWIYKGNAVATAVSPGHKENAIGWNDALQEFIFLNSKGLSYGDNGYEHIPYQRFLDDPTLFPGYAITAIQG